jgi:hypothetical protein
VNSVRAKAQKIRELLGYITIDNERLGVFTDAKNRLLSRISQKISNWDRQEKIISEIDSSKMAFERNDYVQESASLKEAAELGGAVQEQLAQCNLFVDGLEQFNQKQYEQAENSFSKIKKNDRHYNATIIWLKKTRKGIFERDYGQKLDEAWKKLDWSLLEKLTKEIEENIIFEKSSPFAKQLNTTKYILEERKLYLSEAESVFCSAAGHLKQIEKCLEENPHDLPSNAQQWFVKEWNNLTPKIETEITSLTQNSNTAWSNYKKNPITDIEIEDLTAASDYTPIKSKVKYLQVAHQKLFEADKRAEIIDRQSDVRKLLSEVESEIKIHCTHLFKRAYTIDDYDASLAAKLYEVVIAMPAFSDNNYPAQAKSQLENLRKQY